MVPSALAKVGLAPIRRDIEGYRGINRAGAPTVNFKGNALETFVSTECGKKTIDLACGYHPM